MPHPALRSLTRPGTTSPVSAVATASLQASPPRDAPRHGEHPMPATTTDASSTASVEGAPWVRTYVLDTCVLLADPHALFRFHEHDVVLPLVVIEELDG